MKQEGRDALLSVILILLKIATAFQTGADTLAVTGSWLAVILIDLAFLALWSYLAYAGGGKEARRNKTYAAVGAVGLYGAMFVIGFQAHGGQFWALAVRLSGAVALGFDVWTFGAGAVSGIVGSVRRRQAERRAKRPDPLVAQRGRLRTRLLRRAQRRAARKLRENVEVLIFDQWRDDLPDRLPRLPDMTGVSAEVVEAEVRRVWTKEERQAELPALVGDRDDDQLAAYFGVSERTIRRDKAQLGLS